MTSHNFEDASEEFLELKLDIERLLRDKLPYAQSILDIAVSFSLSHTLSLHHYLKIFTVVNNLYTVYLCYTYININIEK